VTSGVIELFVDPDQLDSTALLQGDVVAGIQILGAINIQNISHLTPGAGAGEVQGWTVLQKPKIAHAAVLSHSCEIDRRNNIKVTSVILAPLRDINSATSPDKIQEVIDSNLIDQSVPGASYLKYFYLPAAEGNPYAAGAVVDFSKCFSVRNQAYDYLLEKKVLQLRDDVRRSMSLKLALYFHREQQAA